MCVVVSLGEYMKCVSTCVSLYGSTSVWKCAYGERMCVIVCLCVIILVWVKV